MGDKSIRKTEKKKKKKVVAVASTSPISLKTVVIQPELITKKKKPQ